jgi:hypothetical protein
MALAIHEFVNHGFDYSCIQKFVVQGFPSIIRGFSYKLFILLIFFGQNSGPLLSAVMVFEGLSQNATLAENEAALYFKNTRSNLVNL